MKLDKIKFAMLVALMTDKGANFNFDELADIDALIDINVPEPVQGRANAVDVERMMELMVAGNQKIEAIKMHRMMTGMGLKESKDAVERYWGNSPEAKLIARIRQALGTNADGNELVAIAKAAYRNGEELASQHNFDEPATLGDILHSTGRTKAGNNIG